MEDYQAENLGLRALALGMPWVDGLLDGSKYKREGAEDACGCCPAGSGCWYYEHGTLSWPDFRDPVTEAWLVAWAIPLVSHHPKWGEEGPVYWAPFWRVHIHTRTRRIDEEADTRAEAWIIALEKLRGGK